MTRAFSISWLLGFISVLGQSLPAAADPLDLFGLDALSDHLACKAWCEAGPAARLPSCLALCTTPQADWEKDAVAPLTGVDLQLGVLEHWDEGTLAYICYQDTAVKPKPLCDCQSVHTPAECADQDGDGIPLWLEQQLGTSDSAPQAACTASSTCGGFQFECRTPLELGRGVCLPRPCRSTNSCTAFHLQKVAENNQELVVLLHFDYAPVPATVLDLYLSFPKQDLALVDVRPLPRLVAAQKQIATGYTSNGLLRLTVLGTASTQPIPFGPILELAFRRTSNRQAQVSFALDDFQQAKAIAPSQGAYQDQLKNDALWGSAIQVGAADPNGKRLTLHYSFDDPARPLAYSEAPALCDLVAGCKNQSDTNIKQKEISLLGALQRGVAALGQRIEGVSGPGAYLGGGQDHLELPIVLNMPSSKPSSGPIQPQDQSFSLSTWFYSEANPTSGRQLLLSHNNQSSEKTRFGLLIEPVTQEWFNLLWFEDDLLNSNLATQVVGFHLPVRVWTHLGMTVDALNKKARFTLNGEPSPREVTLHGDSVIACPGFEASPGTGILLHKEGDLNIGGRSPEVLYLASSRQGIQGIEQMDLRGLSRRDIIREVDSAAQDPDYSPVVDKVVYSSNASGNYEIWIANGDGTDRKQITVGFGDTARKVFARRPKFAPDATAIVFESNVYSIPHFDNWWSRSSRLYYIEYDPAKNEVAIPLASGNKVAQLDYESLASSQAVGNYRLTKADKNHTGVVWLKAKDPNGTSRGVVLYSTSDLSLKSQAMERLDIPANILQCSPSVQDPFPTSQEETSLLAAYRAQPAGQPEIQRVLFKKIFASYEPAEGFLVAFESTQDGKVVARVTHQPVEPEPRCWDLNHNNACDSNEDRDGNHACELADCYPTEVRNLYLAYNPRLHTPDADSLKQTEFQIPGTDSKKVLEPKDTSTSTGAFIRLELRSPTNNTPLPAGLEIARIVFAPTADSTGSTDDLELQTRLAHDDLFFWAPGAPGAEAGPVAFQEAAFYLDEVTAAAFSPSFRPGIDERVILAGVKDARPVLVLATLSSEGWDFETISPLPMDIEGLDWVRIDRYYPCNWVGAFREPSSKQFLDVFRGGLDELKVYSYVREEAGFRSDAGIGLERLRKEGRLGAVASLAPSCVSSDSECPPYYLCDRGSGQCKLVGCTPGDPYSCKRGLCTLSPAALGSGPEVPAWVCAVDCNQDRECFSQECLNGPCRFCDAGSQSCIECRTKVDDYGTFQIESIEGCPDRNSFSCEAGSCETECYRFENGEARYLCDRDLEYCKQGRCALLDWDWTDFAPASFLGLGETFYDLPNLAHTTAISQLYTVEIQAYGVEDYGHPPELLVEGKVTTEGAQVYAGNWFEIGRVLVYHQRKTDAGAKPYVLYTPFPVTNLRLRLITPPYENLNAASTGLNGKDGSFCLAQAEAWARQSGQPVDYSPCYRRASGSRPTLGYEGSIPGQAAAKACDERVQADPAYGADCGYVEDADRKYLMGGQPAVIVLDLKVNTSSVMNNITSDKICSYEGDSEPMRLDQNNKPSLKKVFFGNIQAEQSNQKRRFFPNAGATTLKSFSAAFALLNCNLADNTTGEIAGVEAEVFTTYQTLASGFITETKDYCKVKNLEACYEWVGAGATLDIQAAETAKHQTLDFDWMRSFGYEASSLQASTNP